MVAFLVKRIYCCIKGATSPFAIRTSQPPPLQSNTTGAYPSLFKLNLSLGLSLFSCRCFRTLDLEPQDRQIHIRVYKHDQRIFKILDVADPPREGNRLACKLENPTVSTINEPKVSN